jgi:UPF0271 protein
LRNPTEKTNKKVIVLDTSAFLAGFDLFSISEEQYTVPMVRKEIIGDSMLCIRFKTAIDSGKLKVKSPNKAFLNRIKEAAKDVGDVFFLSETDFQVLALALELEGRGFSPLIVTDDYSIQNVADQLHIKFASLATFGIRFRLQWIRYCPACYRRYPADYKSSKCKICGTELKRKPLSKKPLKS